MRYSNSFIETFPGRAFQSKGIPIFAFRISNDIILNVDAFIGGVEVKGFGNRIDGYHSWHPFFGVIETITYLIIQLLMRLKCNLIFLAQFLH